MAITLTQADLLAVLDGFFHPSYLDPIRVIGPGYELYQGAAAVAERIGLAISRLDDDAYVASAQGPQLAVVIALFYRQNGSAGSVTVKAGTLVRASINGAGFMTIEDAVFTGSALGPIAAAAQSVGYGYEYNVPGQFIAPNGDVGQGAIDLIDLPLQDPPYGDPSILVTNVDPATGGRPPALDIHGSERLLRRRPNESDIDYRARQLMVTDTVAPAAIRRQLQRFLDPTGLKWRAVETWASSYQTCWDALDGMSLFDPNYSPDLFCYDDPRAESPVENRWLGTEDHVGAFLVEVELPSVIEMYGFAYDDPALADGDHVSALGRRAMSAYDVPITLPDSALAPAYDGTDFGADDLFSGLQEMLDRVKAYGVLATIYVVQTPGF